MSTEEILTAMNRFPRSSAGGFDGLRPRHLLDMIGVRRNGNENPLLQSLIDLCELFLNGQIPSFSLPYIFGANLSAFMKKGGGVRPIACGLLWRRLATKVALLKAGQLVEFRVLPEQLGCGTRGGPRTSCIY